MASNNKNNIPPSAPPISGFLRQQLTAANNEIQQLQNDVQHLQQQFQQQIDQLVEQHQQQIQQQHQEQLHQQGEFQ